MDDQCSLNIACSIDARGLSCPLPLLKAKQGLASLAEGDILELWASDKGSWDDIRSFAELSPHTLMLREERDGQYHYLLEKGKA